MTKQEKSRREYLKRYQQKNYVKIYFILDKYKDRDIIKFFSKVKNKSEFIRHLLRDRNGKIKKLLRHK